MSETLEQLVWCIALLILLKGVLGQRISILVGLGVAMGLHGALILLDRWSSAPDAGSVAYGLLLTLAWVVLALVCALLRPSLVRLSSILLFDLKLGWLAESPINRPPVLLLAAIAGAVIVAGVHLFLPAGMYKWPTVVLAASGVAGWAWRRFRAWKTHAFTRARSDFTFWQR